MAAPSGGGGRTDGSAKSIVADQISQSVQSTSNLIHLMRQSSPSHAQLMKLPRNLLAKTSTIKNTEMVLEQLPQVVSLLDAHVERGLQRSFTSSFLIFKIKTVKHCSMPHLNTVIQLLSNMQNSQLKSLSTVQFIQEVSVDSTVCIFPQGEIKQYFVKWSMCRPFGVGDLLSALGLDGYEEVSQVKLKVAAADGAVSLSLWSIAD